MIWEDAFSSGSNIAKGDMDGSGLYTQTVGFWVEQTKKGLILAQNDAGHTNGGVYRNYMVIPTQYIRKIQIFYM